MKKPKITVSATLKNVEQLKELLLEIEALSEKYVVYFELKRVDYSSDLADPQFSTVE